MIRASDTLAVVALVIGLGCSFNSNAGMRCGTHLINEGDTISRMISACGTPSQNNYSDVIYDNLNGWKYHIHVGPDGIIDNIDSDVAHD